MRQDIVDRLRQFVIIPRNREPMDILSRTIHEGIEEILRLRENAKEIPITPEEISQS